MFRPNYHYVIRRWVSKKMLLTQHMEKVDGNKRCITGQLVDPMYLVTVHDTHMGEGLGPIWKPVLERAHKFKNKKDAEIVRRMLRLDENIAHETLAYEVGKPLEKFYFDVYPAFKDSKGVWE